MAPRRDVDGKLARQVVEPDVDQELEAVRDLAHDALGDLAFGALELERAEELERSRERPAREIKDGVLAQSHVPSFAAQPRTAALGAELWRNELRELLAHDERVGLTVAALETRHHALERVPPRRGAAALARVLEGDRFLARAVKDDSLYPLVEHLPRLLEIEAVVARERLQHRVIEVVAPVPAANGTARKRQVRMHDDALHVEHLDRTEAVAARTGAHRVVEREQARLELRQRVFAAGHRAGVARGEDVLAPAVGFERQ